jgi:hypothetical protein
MSKKIICLFALALGLAGSASARLIVYEGFDYATGSLGGNAGGAGWDSGVAWDGTQTVTAPGMEWPDLPVVGNKVASGGTASFRKMPTGFSALNNTIWISFLCQNSATPSWSGISPFNGSSEALFLGKPDGSAYWGLVLYNAMNDSGAATGSRLSAIPISEQVFFVVRIINGASSSQITAWLNPDLAGEPTVDTAFFDSGTAGVVAGRVSFDRIRINGAGAVFYDELRIGQTYADVSATDTRLASKPNPGKESEDMPSDSALSWTAGKYAATHDVYLGTSFEDVNEANTSDPRGILVSQGQADTTFDPEGQLEYGQTYYWRIDEVNAAPDYTVFKGNIWSFTTEPYSYPITSVTVTTSSEAPASPAIRTIDKSGLNDADQHSTDTSDMWMTQTLPAWVQYSFDKEYTLHELWVWNSNSPLEPFMGLGAKDVTVEYSTDGQTWTALENVPEFAQATASATYTANTTVSFGEITAKYVKLTINDNWGASLMTGLSEVRFFYTPVQAFEPAPADGAAKIGVDAELSWRPGRKATSHNVYLGTDANDVAAGTVPVETVIDHSYTPDALDLGTAYYWRVDEAGETGVYEGNLWTFTTQEFLTIDDFESYNDDIEAETTIWHTWIDGLATQTSGSQVGYNDSPFAEQKIIHGGKQSMPLQYNNTSFTLSEATRTFDSAQNWTTNGADTLSLYFRGITPSFAQSSDGEILMNGLGWDIEGSSDSFRFAYKSLTGNGSIVARVNSLYASHTWAKAGVMIRQSDAAGATNVMMAKTPGSGNGASFQWRLTVAGTTASVQPTETVGFPYWVKLERSGNSFTAYTSPDGAAWTQLGEAQTIAMTDPVLIGLALTSHDSGIVTGASFSNVATTGNVAGNWQIAEIGEAQKEGNSIERIYLTVKDSSKTATLLNPDTLATGRQDWQQWQIPLSDLTAAGVKITAIQSITLGVGNPTSPAVGGTGTVYFDDIVRGKPLQ